MKIVYICSTLDLNAPFGATPVHWQIMKAMYELGNEVLAIPYFGGASRTLWWRAESNPCLLESRIFLSISNALNSSGKTKSVKETSGFLGKVLFQGYRYVSWKWTRKLKKVLQEHNDVDCIIVAGVPLNQFKGVASYVSKEHNLPIFYYDMDVPTSLPDSGGFSFSYYHGADVTEYDAFVIPSEGSISRLRELGVHETYVMHFGADLELYSPLKVPKETDVFFYGTNSNDRESYIESLVATPSELSSYQFAISARKLNCKTGRARVLPLLQFSQFRRYSCQSKINLNITREKHANTLSTSTSRPFELAAMQSCIVSGPHRGIENWFRLNSEIFMADNSKDALDIYKWLITNPELREKTSLKAWHRVASEHTFKHRVGELLDFIENYINKL